MIELVVLLSAAVVFLAWRWWSLWRVRQLYKSLEQVLEKAQQSPPQLKPESEFVVRISDESVSCQRPDGTVEQVTWDDLERVDILNTSDGPLLPDQFWVLMGASSRCIIPWGATGSGELLDRLQSLPGFDNLGVIESASSTTDSVRTCWQKAV